MTYKEFLDAVFLRRTDTNERSGQAAFNVLYENRPELADEIRGTSMDPFYQDNKLGEFLPWVEAKLCE